MIVDLSLALLAVLTGFAAGFPLGVWWRGRDRRGIFIPERELRKMIHDDQEKADEFHQNLFRALDRWARRQR